MAMAWIWTGIVVFSVIYSTITGTVTELGASAIDGAAAAVELCIGICGITCLWMGLMEIMNRTGIAGKLSALFRPLLKNLFPQNAKNEEALKNVSANMSANLLGLGNAATPLGIKAAEAMARLSRAGTASNDLCMLIVINTASIQLIPATVAGVRAAAGSQAPFDILPAVWITSLASVTAGILAAKLLGKVWKH